MIVINPFLLCDSYKTSHKPQYPDGTSFVYGNFTPRSSKHSPFPTNSVVSFGQQMTMRYIHEIFNRNFFAREKDEVIGEIKMEYETHLGMEYDTSHIEDLWDLGYLPIRVKGIPEGRMVPIGVPLLTICNTLPRFYWLPNFLETLLSNLMWKPVTSATIAAYYRGILEKWAVETDKGNKSFVLFQGHDFSMRGLSGVDSVVQSGLGHLTSFMGSDSMPAITGARHYYDEVEKRFVCGSVPATEHSVMCAGTQDDELETFRRLNKIFPSGILSIVSDTWDLWKVLTEYLPAMKDEILARDGKIVIRPDSGDPVDIICGTRRYEDTTGSESTAQERGVVEILWDTFGGEKNHQGYKVLNPHIGCIYGDSITPQRADEICRRLEAKGFASTNVVLGIGSFTYQYNTRDSYGMAMKATYVEVMGECIETTEDKGKIHVYEVHETCPNCNCIESREIFKDPVTDDGTKKSAKGLLKVEEDDFGKLVLVDQVSREEEEQGVLQKIYENGRYYNKTTLTEIRERLW